MKYDLIIVKNLITGTPPVSSSIPVSVLHKNIDLDYAIRIYSSSIERCLSTFSPRYVLTSSYQIGTTLN